MNTIDVRGLPEPVARALQSLTESLRQQLNPDRGRASEDRVKLMTRPGKVLGPLTRTEIYKDVG